MNKKTLTGIVKKFKSFTLAQQKLFIAGFIDGESNFTISFRRNKSQGTRNPLGHTLSVTPSFFLYQLNIYESVDFLEYINEILFENKGRVRPKNDKASKSDVWVLELTGTQIIITLLLPYLDETILINKNYDYERFATIVRMVHKKEHFSKAGFVKIVHLAYEMNQDGKQRKTQKEDLLKDLDTLFAYYDTLPNRQKNF